MNKFDIVKNFIEKSTQKTSSNLFYYNLQYIQYTLDNYGNLIFIWDAFQANIPHMIAVPCPAGFVGNSLISKETSMLVDTVKISLHRTAVIHEHISYLEKLRQIDSIN